MPGDDQLVEVYGLLLGHPVETEIVEEEQVRGEEGTGRFCPWSGRSWPEPWP